VHGSRLGRTELAEQEVQERRRSEAEKPGARVRKRSKEGAGEASAGRPDGVQKEWGKGRMGKGEV